MNSIRKIKNRIAALLQKEIDRSNAEIQELRQKQHDNMASYGIGGPYNRYEKAIARRETHIKELEALQKVQGCAVILEPLRMYGYFCPSCSEKFYLTGRHPDTVDCPICMRRIYRDGIYTEWNVQKNSQYTCLHHK